MDQDLQSSNKDKLKLVYYVLGILFIIIYAKLTMDLMGNPWQLMIDYRSDYLIYFIANIPSLLFGLLFLFLGSRRFRDYRWRFRIMVYLLALYTVTAPMLRFEYYYISPENFGLLPYLAIGIVIFVVGSLIASFLPKPKNYLG